MGTPAAVGVYDDVGVNAPDNVRDRAWHGVYHHYDGYLSGLGSYLLEYVLAHGGDLETVVQNAIDAAPNGWTSLQSGERLENWPALSSTDGLTSVAFCYVFDVLNRRMDAFATHAEANGELITSVTFGDDGTPNPRFLDLAPEELVEDAPPGKEAWIAMTPRALMRQLRSITPLRIGDLQVGAVNAALTERGLTVLWRFCSFEDGVLSNIAEKDALLVPTADLKMHNRVKEYLAAWGSRAPAYIENAKTVWEMFPLVERCALERCRAQTRMGFEQVLGSSRYFGLD